MKSTFILFLAIALGTSQSFSQSLEEKRTYYDPYVRAHLKEVWTVLPGTATKHGTYKAFDSQGGLVSVANYKNNKLDGERKEYFTLYRQSTGQLKIRQIFRNGELIEESTFFDNGKKNYHKVVNGTWTYWHENGTVGMIAKLYPEGSWNGGNFDLSASDSEAPKGDDYYILNALGDLIKVKEVKMFYENKLVGENYFGEDGLTIKNIDYDANGRKLVEWYKYPDSNLYNQIAYNDNGIKLIETEFLLERKPNSGAYKHHIAIKHGKQKFFDLAGNLVNEVQYDHDKRYGKWKLYFDQNWTEQFVPEGASYYREITFDDSGKPTGLAKDYFINGTVQWEGRLLQVNPDVYDGECKWYYENGNLANIKNFAEGILEGVSTSYHESGVKTQTDVYEQGKIKSATAYFESGITAQIVQFSFSNDSYYARIIGDCIYYYESENIESEGQFEYSGNNPVKIGSWKYYNEKGDLVKTETWSKDGRLLETKSTQ